ncbi:MAG TPA: glycoside hydrolase family 27 protein [Terriglobales bacterium]|nr:glycoside hydrolase family 27 protein [Terriglobales bacterium]
MNKFKSIRRSLLFFAISVASVPSFAASGVLAQTPPMGWNSWDGYGTTINEEQFKANASWFAQHLKPYGWQYVVIDMEWFVENPVAEGNSKAFKYSMDEEGRYVPPGNRFPSAANSGGFKLLADYTHSLGLKFGIHILRGIPKEAVTRNLPIADSPYHAADAAITSDTCSWNFDNYGIDAAKPAGQAYYDSIIKLYASWGVDLIKVDCISSGPYKGDEIRSISEAIARSGRPIVLSLSPGPAPIEKAQELKHYAQMWRISNDIWDIWHNSQPYPQGVGDQFQNAAAWAPIAEPGHWPDADMLPIGRLGPAPGWGKPRNSRLTHDEQRTLLTLWCISRSPLMVGGDLSAADDWTASLLTNPEVLAADQRSQGARQLSATKESVIWTARAETGGGAYVAIFNISQKPLRLHQEWKSLGLSPTPHRVRDLWHRKDLGKIELIQTTLPAHGSLLYKVSAQ